MDLDKRLEGLEARFEFLLVDIRLTEEYRSAFREFLALLNVANEEWGRFSVDRELIGGYSKEAVLQELGIVYDALEGDMRLFAVEMAYHAYLIFLTETESMPKKEGGPYELWRETVARYLESKEKTDGVQVQ